MCLILPAPFRLAIAKAADESAYTTPSLFLPKSLSMLLTPRSSAAHFTIAISSASAELRVMWF
jgi:hypothetical protein